MALLPDQIPPASTEGSSYGTYGKREVKDGNERIGCVAERGACF
jgi:hypothetical protein